MTKQIPASRPTNMQEIKQVAHTLLHTPIVPCEQFGFLVHHPFTNSSTVNVRNETTNNPEIVCILESTSEKDKWVRHVQKLIDRCETPWQIMMLMNKPYYFAFIKFAHKWMSNKDLAMILAHAWVSVEYSNDDKNLKPHQILKLMESVDPRYLMTEEDYQVYESLPDELTVYRGTTKYNHDKSPQALSWTLDPKVATFFADRFNTGTGRVYSKKIHKSEIVAYFDTRNEKEVIVRPSSEIELSVDLM